MADRPSSKRWKQRQARDPYVRQAHSQGLRSRAAFKLKELDQRDKLLHRGAVVLDLGAAPGGWSQVAAEAVGPAGRVIAVDVLAMDPLPGVQFIQGDFTDEEVFNTVEQTLRGRKADLVLSDMSPNITGHNSVDQPRAMYLAELAVDMARRTLKPGGGLVMKVFQGEGFDALLRELHASFSAVRVRKPQASRAESREIYLVAGKYRL